MKKILVFIIMLILCCSCCPEKSKQQREKERYEYAKVQQKAQGYIRVFLFTKQS